MSIKRFCAKTTREVLYMVRDELGPGGVILSNRATDGGIEILALGPEDITALMPPYVERVLEDIPQRRQEDFRAENGSRGQASIPSSQENFVEREVKAITGIKAIKDLPRLHFPTFDGKQEQVAKRWITPELTPESRHTREPVLDEVPALPEPVREDMNQRRVFASLPVQGHENVRVYVAADVALQLGLT